MIFFKTTLLYIYKNNNVLMTFKFIKKEKNLRFLQALMATRSALKIGVHSCLTIRRFKALNFPPRTGKTRKSEFESVNDKSCEESPVSRFLQKVNIYN